MMRRFMMDMQHRGGCMVRRLGNFMHPLRCPIMLCSVCDADGKRQQHQQSNIFFCHSQHGAEAITEIFNMQIGPKSGDYSLRISFALTVRIKS